MLKGLSLQELAAKIEGQRELKHDLIADTGKVDVTVDSDRHVSLVVPDQGSFPVLPLAHDQIGAHTDIPSKYYNRMLAQQPELLATNIRTWFQAKPKGRMLRTMGGDLRAFLSNRYQRIENEEIAAVALPVLADLPEVRIVSCEVTERRMYIQAVTPRIQGEVKVGDAVQAGVIISNSEVGLGAVSVAPIIFRLVCLNGMVVPDRRFSARHVGGRIETLEDLLSDEAKRADDRAVLLKVRDVVKAAVDEAHFGKTIDKLRGLTDGRVTGDPALAVEVLAKKVGATEAERGGILRSLIEGGDLSRWGLLNAVTAQAHVATNYDRSVEIEQMGGAIIDLPDSEWREVLQAA